MEWHCTAAAAWDSVSASKSPVDRRLRETAASTQSVHVSLGASAVGTWWQHRSTSTSLLFSVLQRNHPSSVMRYRVLTVEKLFLIEDWDQTNCIIVLLCPFVMDSSVAAYLTMLARHWCCDCYGCRSILSRSHRSSRAWLLNARLARVMTHILQKLGSKSRV